MPLRDDTDDLLDIFDDHPQIRGARPATAVYMAAPPGYSGPLTGKEYERYLRGEALKHDRGVISVELPSGDVLSARVDPSLWRAVDVRIHALDPPIGRDHERQTVAIFFNLPLAHIGDITYPGNRVGRGVVHVRADQAWLYAFFCVACRMVAEFSDYFRAGYAALEQWSEECTQPEVEFLTAYNPPVEVEGCQVFELHSFNEPNASASAAGLRVYVTCADGNSFKRFKGAALSAIYAERPRNKLC